jgi:hypothetical protein
MNGVNCRTVNDHRENRKRMYTTLVAYAMPDTRSPVAGAKSMVIPAVLARHIGGADGFDIAPYATMVEMTELAGGVQIELLTETDADRQATLTTVLDWIDEVSMPWVAVQLEPAAIAGDGTASIETDPNLPA